MHISAKIKSSLNNLETVVTTNDSSKNLNIPHKATGYGSSVNGGELLLLSLATCFCNDIYREAAKINMIIQSVEVVSSCEFGAEGELGFNFQYHTHIVADASPEEIKSLIAHTDKVAEIHNTLRRGVKVNINELS